MSLATFLILHGSEDGVNHGPQLVTLRRVSHVVQDCLSKINTIQQTR
jgi:hypothetical protein